MRYALVCDFDGTVAIADVGADFVRHFGSGPTHELESALERWRAGEIGHRELTRVECRRLVVTLPQALAFTRRFELDPAFPGFARELARDGHAVEVASEGFDFYISDLLARAGAADVQFSSNRLRFEPGERAVPEFPHTGGCGRCGNCKGERVRELKRRGFTTVMVGDGLSDRCGARAADRVVARGELLEWCRAEGIAAEPFESFADVAAWTRGLIAN
jgi:2-hydroxy-3-keto-5-methylthiopentenyl-1-phosphate phosphatase